MTCTRLEVFKESSGGKRNVGRAIYRIDLPMGMPLERTHGNIELTAAQDERRKNAHAQAILHHSHNRIVIPGRQLGAHRQPRPTKQRRNLIIGAAFQQNKLLVGQIGKRDDLFSGKQRVCRHYRHQLVAHQRPRRHAIFSGLMRDKAQIAAALCHPLFNL